MPHPARPGPQYTAAEICSRRRPGVRLHLETLEARLTPSGDFGFALAAGGQGADRGAAVASDAAGNVCVTGSFSGTAAFGSGPAAFTLTSAGGTDVFVAKYTAAGALLWARDLGGSGDDAGAGVTVDGAGNVYTTGSFSGTADFDPGAAAVNLTSAGAEDVFVWGGWRPLTRAADSARCSTRTSSSSSATSSRTPRLNERALATLDPVKPGLQPDTLTARARR